MLHKAINQALSFYHLFLYFFLFCCRHEVFLSTNLEVCIALVPLKKGQWDFTSVYELICSLFV